MCIKHHKNTPRLLTISITRETVSFMKSFYNLKFKTNTIETSWGRLHSYIRMKTMEDLFLILFLKFLFLLSEQ